MGKKPLHGIIPADDGRELFLRKTVVKKIIVKKTVVKVGANSLFPANHIRELYGSKKCGSGRALGIAVPIMMAS